MHSRMGVLVCVSVCYFVRKWLLISRRACGCERLMGKYLPCPALSTQLSLHCGGESYAASRSAISAAVSAIGVRPLKFRHFGASKHLPKV